MSAASRAQDAAMCDVAYVVSWQVVSDGEGSGRCAMSAEFHLLRFAGFLVRPLLVFWLYLTCRPVCYFFHMACFYGLAAVQGLPSPIPRPPARCGTSQAAVLYENLALAGLSVRRSASSHDLFFAGSCFGAAWTYERVPIPLALFVSPASVCCLSCVPRRELETHVLTSRRAFSSGKGCNAGPSGAQQRGVAGSSASPSMASIAGEAGPVSRDAEAYLAQVSRWFGSRRRVSSAVSSAEHFGRRSSR